MNPQENINSMSRKTGLPSRALRYTIEKDSMPGLVPQASSRGTERKITRSEARFIALASYMSVHGITSKVIRNTLAIMDEDSGEFGQILRNFRVGATDPPKKGWRFPRLLIIADGSYLRFADTHDPEISSEWFGLGGASTPTDPLKPLTTIAVDLWEIARRFPNLE